MCRLGGGDDGRVSARVTSPVLVGRREELGVLGGVLDRAAAGEFAVATIGGEAGIGKTRLLQGALEKARHRGLRVAAAGTAELERTRPFGLAAGMFGCTRSAPDPLRAAIAELLARGDRGDREAQCWQSMLSDPSRARAARTSYLRWQPRRRHR